MESQSGSLTHTHPWHAKHAQNSYQFNNSCRYSNNVYYDCMHACIPPIMHVYRCSNSEDIIMPPHSPFNQNSFIVPLHGPLYVVNLILILPA